MSRTYISRLEGRDEDVTPWYPHRWRFSHAPRQEHVVRNRRVAYGCRCGHVGDLPAGIRHAVANQFTVS